MFLGLSKILSYPKTQTPPKRDWYLTVSCWLKKKWGWRKNQIALSLCWACMGEIENIQENNRFEYFLSALPLNKWSHRQGQEMKNVDLQEISSAGRGLFEEKQWTLHSKARWLHLNGGLESPCREKANIHWPKFISTVSVWNTVKNLEVGLPLWMEKSLTWSNSCQSWLCLVVAKQKEI